MDNKSRDKVLDWIIIIAALVLFPKTADLLSFFAPENVAFILGMDVSWLYGMISASLVEGALLALHFNPRARIHTPAKIVMWMLVAMSGAAQILDGYIATGNEANMSDPMKFGLQFGVPLVPLIVLIMIVAIGEFPDTGMARTPFKGIKNIVGPAVKRLWSGEEGASAEVSLTNPDESGTNGQVKSKSNRERRIRHE